jgi:hypothetical protein
LKLRKCGKYFARTKAFFKKTFRIIVEDSSYWPSKNGNYLQKKETIHSDDICIPGASGEWQGKL